MSYTRVIPRDLFNEAKLLKCYGQLALNLHDHPVKGVQIIHETSADYDYEGFVIHQRDSDGSLSCMNIEVCMVDNSGYWLNGLHFYTAYNSKEPYPMYTTDKEGDEIAVFTNSGEFTKEFTTLLSTLSTEYEENNP